MPVTVLLKLHFVLTKLVQWETFTLVACILFWLRLTVIHYRVSFCWIVLCLKVRCNSFSIVSLNTWPSWLVCSVNILDWLHFAALLFMAIACFTDTTIVLQYYQRHLLNWPYLNLSFKRDFEMANCRMNIIIIS